MTEREIHWKLGGRDVAIRIEESNGRGVLHSDDRSISFSVHDREDDGGWLNIDGQNHRFYVYRDGNKYAVWLNGQTYRLERFEKGRHGDAAVAGPASGEVRSLMPGKILRVDVQEGDTVTVSQTVIIMESMKMETSLISPIAGTVTVVNCKVGDIVEMGQLLVSLTA